MSDSLAAITGSVPKSTTTVQGKSSLGKDDFLKLLIEQMKNQDPMNPMDGSAYASQLAQFSSLEQLSNLNTSMTNSTQANLQLVSSVSNTMSAALIGKQVKFSGTTIKYTGESSGTIGYNLPSEAKSVTIKIYDSNNKLVQTLTPTELKAGDHTVNWDYKNASGTTVPQGTYHFEFTVKDYLNKDITPTTWTQGTISSIRYSQGGTKMVVGKSEYDISDITEILNAPTGS